MIGRTLNHYEIIEPLGAGGMGEVYLAKDTSLDRLLALKVLPADLASDPERRRRFEREAKAIAALDHPNIVVIHTVEAADTDDGGKLHFITMQLVEGKTLSELIPKNGFPLDKFLDLAIPLADAISAAHEQGIVHRDLKPSNIMVSSDGRVRVLDFGLAKLKDEAKSDDATDVATVQATSGGSEPLTGEGKILGTVAYMSPEQAEGKPVDHRTDMFSLGIILYEMATGERPFKGDTNLSIMSSIVKDVPTSVTDLNRRLPRHLGRVVRHALEKDPDRRFQSAKDLRNDLILLREEVSSGELVVGVSAKSAERPVWGRLLPWGLVAVLVVVSAFVAWDRWRSSSAYLTPSRASLMLPSSMVLDWYGGPPKIAISPDGRQLAFTARSADGQWMIYLWDRADAAPLPLAGTEGGLGPFFSPDGHSLGFAAGGELRTIPIEGGVAPVSLAETPNLRGATWGPEGTIVYSPDFRTSLWRVSADGGEAERLTELDETLDEQFHRWPDMLPEGDGVIFTACASGSYVECSIEVLSFETGERRHLTTGAMARYSPSGHLVIARTAQLLAAPFALDRLELTGSPVPVEVDVLVHSLGPGSAQFDISDSGTLAFLPMPEGRRLVRVGLQKQVQEIAGIPPISSLLVQPRYSPDGRRLAVGTAGEIFIYEFGRNSWSRLPTRAEGTAGQPLSPFGAVLWTPDGEWITFNAWGRGERPNIFRVRADGSGETERLTTGGLYTFPGSWSPDGRLLLLADSNPEWSLWKVPVAGGTPEPLLQGDLNESEVPALSPDGRWLAYHSWVSGQDEVYVRPYPDLRRTWEISAGGGRDPAWSPDGRTIYYLAGRRMVAVDLAFEPEFSPGPPRTLFEGDYIADRGRAYDIAPDGQSFVMMQGEARLRQINLVDNWFEELKRRVPDER